MTSPLGRPITARAPGSICEALTEARVRSGLSQAAAARLISAGVRTWGHWEAGTRAISVNALELWCTAAVSLGHLRADDALVCAWVRPAIRDRLKAPA